MFLCIVGFDEIVGEEPFVLYVPPTGMSIYEQKSGLGELTM